MTKEVDGLIATLPSATRNMYVDGELIFGRRLLFLTQFRSKSEDALELAGILGSACIVLVTFLDIS